MIKNPISSVGDHFLVGLRPSVQLDSRDRALIADVRTAAGRDRMLIAIDHEGGRVCRTPPPITRFSYASRWSQQAAAVGHAMGRELASLGINLNFAPVLAIHSNPSNPVIGARAFGTTGEKVTEAALAFMAAMQSEHVLACGKHFPGHGDTDKDSHRELPAYP